MYGGVKPDRARNDVTMARCTRFDQRHLAAADQLIDHRVVFGELVHLPVAYEVGSGVAYVAKKGSAAAKHGDHQRGSHARFGFNLRGLVDASTGRLARVVHGDQDAVARLKRRRGVEVRHPLGDVRRCGSKRVDADRCGDLTRRASTYAVAHHIDALLGQRGHGVFVVGALLSWVGAGRDVVQLLLLARHV